MAKPEQGSTLAHRRAIEEYNAWKQKDHSAQFTMLATMRNDLIREFEDHPNSKSLWDALEAALRIVGVAFSQEQQIQAVIRLPNSWSDMRVLLTHASDVKTFDDVRNKIELEAERRGTLKTKDVATSAMIAEGPSHKAKKPKRKGFTKRP
ncbi:uncharacterized protein A4U43_C08F17320 [Asparagus officinalis]|nr:uncharacterized protein A4U43_C08F17320 [Asparagus officinalis]